MKRTHLPLNGLRVLDAAARHLSFTRAADELAVTPAAVGQQIRALEDLLGVVLFRRTPKGLELTGEAVAGLDPLREGFLRFEEAVQAIQAGQSSHVYTIAVPRDLLGLWLAPRLAGFRHENPQVRYALVAGDAEMDFTEANLDLAIRFGEGPGELEGVALGNTDRVVVTPSDGDGIPAWIGWPGDAVPDGEEPALSVADAGLAISAAAAGLGRARVPALLADAALAAGQRIALGTREACRHGYWLVAPTPQWRQKKVKALVGYLTA
ncbi:LysR family transcriptional regulator [Novosphingobium sp. Gsoil 351]|uniref:LysR family transcriptional regulator n=1 Tax=Novosphingobium sp. Gsoil 351 TaxID=2675225 RepID=UPI0012B4655E|nr:LysR family transcriptional regulator [Novosphingobium sp. Gsoil 351]QGN55936.1 LysR family transcriptional regulator [Novosphingobium sp. Gsoil 351]